MAEYISKQAFKEKYLCCGWLPEMSEEEFNSFPAAGVVPVRHPWPVAMAVQVRNKMGRIEWVQTFESVEQARRAIR